MSMKINSPVVCFGIFLSLLASGCSKSVSKESRNQFRQTEPEPSPTFSPSPAPSPSPSPTASPVPVGCVPARLGDLPSYAVYTKEDLKLSDVSISRRVAASDAEISRSVIGLLLNPDAARADLQVTHELGVHTVGVPKGKATYGKSLSMKKSTALGGFAQAPFSVSEKFRALTEFSNACADVAANVTVKRTCVSAPIPVPSEADPKPQICTLYFKGTHPTLNIAEVPLGLLAGSNILSVDVPSGSTFIANLPDVRSAKFTAVVVAFPKDVPAPVTYWNFPNAEDLEFKKTLYRGVVIAPEAEVKIDTQSGDAGYWSRTLEGAKSVW